MNKVILACTSILLIFAASARSVQNQAPVQVTIDADPVQCSSRDAQSTAFLIEEGLKGRVVTAALEKCRAQGETLDRKKASQLVTFSVNPDTSDFERITLSISGNI